MSNPLVLILPFILAATGSSLTLGIQSPGRLESRQVTSVTARTRAARYCVREGERRKGRPSDV